MGCFLTFLHVLAWEGGGPKKTPKDTSLLGIFRNIRTSRGRRERVQGKREDGIPHVERDRPHPADVHQAQIWGMDLMGHMGRNPARSNKDGKG